MYKKLIFGACLLVTASSQAAPADDLVELIGGKNQIHQMHEQFIAVIASSNPDLAKKQPIIKRWAEKYLTWEEMKAGLVKVYKRHYSDQEIKALLAFYNTPVGKKSIDLLPTLFAEGAQVGNNIALKYQPKLLEMLSAAE